MKEELPHRPLSPEARHELVGAHLREAADKLREFAHELRVHMDATPESFVEPAFEDSALGFSGQGRDAPSRLDECVACLDAAARVAGMTDLAGTPVERLGYRAWLGMIQWKVPDEEKHRLQKIINCGKTVAGRRSNYQLPKPNAQGHHVVSIPLEAERWATAAADYLELLAGRDSVQYPPDLISQARAAEIASVDERTILRWIEKKGLGCYGADRQVSLKELRARLSQLHERVHRKREDSSVA